MTERQGIEIDYCQQCRGVWLDRGELDKIIERSGAIGVAAAPPPRVEARPRSYDNDYRGDHEHRRDHDHDHHRRRKNWLEDLFD
jgi:Zn-finger nucleic acid-binding protein